jgi:hypothetical protein
MSDPLIRSMVKWWFRLFVAGTVSAFLGVVAFIGFGVRAGTMPQSAYVYAVVMCGLTLIALVWIRGKVNSAPEMIERFLGLYRG